MSSTHKIPFRAQGRAKSGTRDFGCTAYYTLECQGNSREDAKKNGLSQARSLARRELLEDARKRFPDAVIIEDSIRVS